MCDFCFKQTVHSFITTISLLMKIRFNFLKFLFVNCYFIACGLLCNQLSCQDEDDFIIWNHRVHSNEYFSYGGRTEWQKSCLFRASSALSVQGTPGSLAKTWEHQSVWMFTSVGSDIQLTLTVQTLYSARCDVFY